MRNGGHFVIISKRICVRKRIIVGSDNGLSPGRHQAIIRTNAALLLISYLGTIISEILIEIHIYAFKKMQLVMSYAKWWPFCPGVISYYLCERFKLPV